MKKYLFLICLVIMSGAFGFSQEIGEKASKEVVIDGQNVSKMMSVTEITMYDEKGNKIYEKDSSGEETWYEFDNKGKVIHMKDSSGHELWYEYDKKGRIIHEKDSSGYEHYKYKYHSGGYTKYTEDGMMIWKYDKKGKLIDGGNGDNGLSFEYNDKGDLIHMYHGSVCAPNREIDEWHEYVYDKKGNKIQEKISVDESYEDIQIKGDDLVFTGNRIENHKESWNYYEYEYWKPGKIKKRIKYSTT